MTRAHTRRFRRPWLLLASTLFIQGCGLGWLYMKVGDSKRIAGIKLLSYDTKSDRFAKAQKAFRGAIDYYNDSILYDDLSNPDVFHKSGFTFLLLTPETHRERGEIKIGARGTFMRGINILNRLARMEGKTSEVITLEQEVRNELQITQDIPGINPVPKDQEAAGEADLFGGWRDENYARCMSGLGQMAFLNAVETRSDANYKLALYYFKLADRASPRSRKPTGKGFMASIMDILNLREVFERVPYIVEVAKIYNYLAQGYQKRGESKLMEYHFTLAREALDEALERYPNDIRVSSERARLAFYREDYKKALEDIDKVIEETDFYADKREFLLLKGQIHNKMGESDAALQAFEWILDKEEFSVEAILGRAKANAAKKDRNSAQADITTLLADDQDNPYLFREAGEIYEVLGEKRSATQMYLKAYYLDKEDIELVFQLGNLYFELDELDQSRDLLDKVVRINPASNFAIQARKLLDQMK